MKKFVTMMLVVILVMSLGMAQAEASIRTAKFSNVQDYGIDRDGTKHYYAYMSVDKSESRIVEIPEETWYILQEAERKSEIDHKNKWYVKALDWCSKAATDVGDFVVFWN